MRLIFTLAESVFGVSLDVPAFQSWTTHPTDMLPESRPGTLLNVAAQYLLPKTELTIGPNAGGWHAELRDANRAPVADAKIRVVAFDVNKRWPMTDRVVRSFTPAGAAYAVLGIRANTEGTSMVDASGSVDIVIARQSSDFGVTL